jgi:hypothetical protein
MLVPDDGKVNDLLTIAYPRCEVEKTLRGGYCDLSGKARLAGLLLCERHVKQLEAQDRRALLEGIVLSLELCLRNITLRRDKELSILLRAQHAQATRELAHALEEDLRWATTQKEEEKHQQ